MTVGELIEKLSEMPKGKVVEIGTLTVYCGEVVRVRELEGVVELESNDEYRWGD